MDPNFSVGAIPPLKLLWAQILLAESSRAEDFRFIKISLLEEKCPDFHVVNKMRQESQVNHQNPNQNLPVGSLFAKLHLNLQQYLLQW